MSKINEVADLQDSYDDDGMGSGIMTPPKKEVPLIKNEDNPDDHLLLHEIHQEPPQLEQIEQNFAPDKDKSFGGIGAGLLVKKLLISPLTYFALIYGFM